MTRLPTFGQAVATPVQFPMATADISRATKFQDIAEILTGAATAAKGIQGFKQQQISHAQQLAQLEHQLKLGKLNEQEAAIALDAEELKRQNFRNQVSTREAELAIDEARDIELFGYSSLLSRLGPDEQAKFMRANPAFDPANAQKIARNIGHQLAAQAMNSVFTEITTSVNKGDTVSLTGLLEKHFNDPQFEGAHPEMLGEFRNRMWTEAAAYLRGAMQRRMAAATADNDDRVEGRLIELSSQLANGEISQDSFMADASESLSTHSSIGSSQSPEKRRFDMITASLTAYIEDRLRNGVDTPDGLRSMLDQVNGLPKSVIKRLDVTQLRGRISAKIAQDESKQFSSIAQHFRSIAEKYEHGEQLAQLTQLMNEFSSSYKDTPYGKTADYSLTVADMTARIASLDNKLGEINRFYSNINSGATATYTDATLKKVYEDLIPTHGPPGAIRMIAKGTDGGYVPPEILTSMGTNLRNPETMRIGMEQYLAYKDVNPTGAALWLNKQRDETFVDIVQVSTAVVQDALSRRGPVGRGERQAIIDDALNKIAFFKDPRAALAIRYASLTPSLDPKTGKPVYKPTGNTAASALNPSNTTIRNTILDQAFDDPEIKVRSGVLRTNPRDLPAEMKDRFFGLYAFYVGQAYSNPNLDPSTIDDDKLHRHAAHLAARDLTHNFAEVTIGRKNYIYPSEVMGLGSWADNQSGGQHPIKAPGVQAFENAANRAVEELRAANKAAADPTKWNILWDIPLRLPGGQTVFPIVTADSRISEQEYLANPDTLTTGFVEPVRGVPDYRIYTSQGNVNNQVFNNLLQKHGAVSQDAQGRERRFIVGSDGPSPQTWDLSLYPHDRLLDHGVWDQGISAVKNVPYDKINPMNRLRYSEVRGDPQYAGESNRRDDIIAHAINPFLRETGYTTFPDFDAIVTAIQMNMFDQLPREEVEIAFDFVQYLDSVTAPELGYLGWMNQETPE